MPEIDYIIGQNIQARSSERGITTTQLARLMNVDVATVESWQQGVQRVGPEDLCKLSIVLSVDITYFFCEMPTDRTNPEK